MRPYPASGHFVRSLQVFPTRNCGCCKDEVRPRTQIQANALILTCGKDKCKTWAEKERRERKAKRVVQKER